MKLTYQQEKAIHQSLINNSSIDLSQLPELTKPYKAVLDLFMKYPNSLSATLSVVTLNSNFLECIIVINVAGDHKLSRKELNSIDKLSTPGGEIFYKEIVTSRHNHNLLLACYLKAMGASVTSNSLEYINCKFKRATLINGPQGLYNETFKFSSIIATMALSDIIGAPRYIDNIYDILVRNANIMKRKQVKTVKESDHYRMEIVDALSSERTVLKITPGGNSSSVVDLPGIECVYDDRISNKEVDEQVRATQLFYSILIGNDWSFSDIPTTPLKVEPTAEEALDVLIALNAKAIWAIEAVRSQAKKDLSWVGLKELDELKETMVKVSEVLK